MNVRDNNGSLNYAINQTSQMKLLRNQNVNVGIYDPLPPNGGS